MAHPALTLPPLFVAFAAIAFLVTGCTSSVRTIAPDQAAQESAAYSEAMAKRKEVWTGKAADDGVNVPIPKKPGTAHPSYALDIDRVHDVAFVILRQVADKVDLDDRAARRMKTHNSNFWNGATDMEVRLATLPNGKTEVQVEVSNAGPSGERSRHVMALYLKKLDDALTIAAPESRKSASERLAELEKMRASGLIKDDEYAKKRASIIEGL